jgi:serine/threonine protein kinase
VQAGERICGRYVLERRLGLGGMGEVWLAELEGAGAFRRRVVIKLLAPERRGDLRIAAMLADEARVVGALHHPGIIAAIDYLETEEQGPVFVLEFVDGVSLRTVLKLARRQNAPLSESLAAHIGAQVAHALHAAHTAIGRDGQPLQVVHRDVAPDNILLSRSGAVYLGDFGVARAAGNLEIAHREGPPGKPGYTAPEQAGGGKVGPAADFFSLGRVIAEAADVSCGPALRAVIERATADNPRNRFATASEMAAALLHACPPPSDPDRAIGEWLHRYAADALISLRSSPGAVPRSDPPPAGRPSATGSRRLERQEPLFAAVPPPKRILLKVSAGVGALLFLVLPLILMLAGARRTRELLHSVIVEGPGASHGDLRVTARPAEGEVYVDGSLRGVTPLILELPAGKHSLRVGSPRLGRWRAAEVNVKDGVEHHLDVNLLE